MFSSKYYLQLFKIFENKMKIKLYNEINKEKLAIYRKNYRIKNKLLLLEKSKKTLSI
tara:strand:- start:1944 stop:2114 length:171 start_codon:yes stop_codon:yes gene_type:complete